MAVVSTMFRPALLVVDYQEDFCPPHGPLAVRGGRDIAPLVNELLALPFVLKVASLDWHPPDHISFYTNHPGRQPFTDMITIRDDDQPDHFYETRLWPPHCVSGTGGSRLVREMDVFRVHHVIQKGNNPKTETYSAFWDPLRLTDSGLYGLLRDWTITHVFVVGLAAEYCVAHTAIDAAQIGCKTVIIEDATRAIDEGDWEKMKRDRLDWNSIKVVSSDGDEVRRVRDEGIGNTIQREDQAA